MERTRHLLTPSSLKALAHPVRVELLGHLRADGPSTATALGARMGESSGTTSYHLRQLEKAGFVVEAEGLGNARERWWRAAQDSTVLDEDALDDTPATRAAEQAYMQVVVDTRTRRIHEWLDGARSWPKRWRDASTLSDYLLHLTPAEAKRLNEQVDALVESYRRPAKKGDEQVVVHWAAFPVRR